MDEHLRHRPLFLAADPFSGRFPWPRAHLEVALEPLLLLSHFPLATGELTRWNRPAHVSLAAGHP